MGGRREANKKAKAHVLVMMAEEQAVRRKREQRAKRREKRRQIRQEDATLADALVRYLHCPTCGLHSTH